MTTAEAREKLTESGMDPKLAAGVVDVLEVWVQERTVTKDYLDARLSDLKADLTDKLRLQTFSIIGLMTVIMGVIANLQYNAIRDLIEHALKQHP
jgi:hypothetical protein